MTRCPRCSSEKVIVERARKPFTDSLVCEACDYVGPAVNPNQDGKYQPTK